MTKIPTINLYGFGGAGINQVSYFNRFIGSDEPYAAFATYLIDTSQSNLDDTIASTASGVFLIDGLDGSGKNRVSNYEAITEKVKSILNKYKPGDINVVVHSASGGSGSVIGPLITSELLAGNHPTIVVTVGSANSKIEAYNTVNTLKSYENIAQRRGRPVICSFFENTEETPRGVVDERIRTVITFLALIFSGRNRELDSADLRNFLAYNTVTTYEPRLTYLDFSHQVIALDDDHAAISVVTLTDEHEGYGLTLPVEHHSVGYVTPVAKEVLGDRLPIHATIVANYFGSRIKRLDGIIAEIDQNRKAFVDRPIVSDHSGSSDGMIF